MVFKTSDWRKLAQVSNLLPIVETSDAIPQETKEKLYKELFGGKNKKGLIRQDFLSLFKGNAYPISPIDIGMTCTYAKALTALYL